MNDLFSVVVLAGGRGTRLRPVLPDLPKVLADIGGRPLLKFLLERAAGLRPARLVACLGDQADRIRHTLGTSLNGIPLHYTQEDRLLGTGGAIRLGLLAADTPWCLVLNGDSFCHGPWIDWAIRYRTAIFPAVAMTVVRAGDCSRYGRVSWEEPSGRVTQFEEKGLSGGPGWINAGIYFIPSSLTHMIPADTPVSWEKEILPRLCAHNLCALPSEGPFLDIGTPESFAQRGDFFASILQQN